MVLQKMVLQNNSSDLGLCDITVISYLVYLSWGVQGIGPLEIPVSKHLRDANLHAMRWRIMYSVSSYTHDMDSSRDIEFYTRILYAL